MAAWQIRAGGDAGRANMFIDEGRVCIGFGVNVSLTKFASRDDLRDWMKAKDDVDQGPLAPHFLWRFMTEVQIGDLVLMPSKPSGREYAIGRIKGGYEFDPSLVEMKRDPHTRKVEWLKTGIPGERLATLSLPRRYTIAHLSDDAEARIETILD